MSSHQFHLEKVHINAWNASYAPQSPGIFSSFPPGEQQSSRRSFVSSTLTIHKWMRYCVNHCNLAIQFVVKCDQKHSYSRLFEDCTFSRMQFRNLLSERAFQCDVKNPFYRHKCNREELHFLGLIRSCFIHMHTCAHTYMECVIVNSYWDSFISESS